MCKRAATGDKKGDNSVLTGLHESWVILACLQRAYCGLSEKFRIIAERLCIGLILCTYP